MRGLSAIFMFIFGWHICGCAFVDIQVDENSDNGSDPDSPDETDENCAGMVCDNPPKNECASKTTIVVYDQNGTCVDGLCVYDTEVEPCESPPQFECAGDTEILVYDTDGYCAIDAGVCVYDGESRPCDQPPPDSCKDESTLITYDAISQCEEGQCDYNPREEQCPYGCVDAVCLQCQNDDECDDGLFCNGKETCDNQGACQKGTAINCDDGVECTEDSCDDSIGKCMNISDDANCSDGLWCNGQEICDPLNGCLEGTEPNCDDGIECTVDSCNETSDVCDHDPDDALCDNGQFCDGLESCDPLNDCQNGTPIDCDDGVSCTDDFCNEENQTCENKDNCGSGEYCDGSSCQNCELDNICGADCIDCTTESCSNCALGHQICSSNGNDCVECNINGDCKSDYSCQNNICEQTAVCNGEIVGGSCWYLGEAGDSCTVVCGGHGSYDQATLTYAGSSGTSARCEAVLNAFSGVGTGLPEEGTCSFGLGCFYDVSVAARRRCVVTATAGTATNAGDSSILVRRVCACTE